MLGRDLPTTALTTVQVPNLELTRKKRITVHRTQIISVFTPFYTVFFSDQFLSGVLY
jgi:hypothetical protein